MDLANLSHTAKLLLGLTGAFIAYQVFIQLTLGRQRRALIRQKGALPSPSWPQWETLLGIDMFRQNMRLFKTHRFQEVTLERFRKMGVNTFQFVALGRRVHITIEPENLKTIQAVNFKQWGLGSRRKIGFRPFLGDGKSSRDLNLLRLLTE